MEKHEYTDERKTMKPDYIKKEYSESELLESMHSFDDLNHKLNQMGYDRPWIDTRLTAEEMGFLNKIILNSNERYGKFNVNQTLAGNISKSERIIDKDDWFYETTLKKLSEKMFYENHIEGDESPLVEFEMNRFWVNYMKQHEFNPIHNHSGLFSFVIFMKIPTHWKEQHALPFSANSNNPCASDFQFVWNMKMHIMGSKKEYEDRLMVHTFVLSPEDEGRMLFFPAHLNHLVYPFYGTEEERVTISGNIYQKGRSERGGRTGTYA